MKICTKCKEEKELSDFHKNKCSIDCLNATCKTCKKLYHLNNKEKNIQRTKKWVENNKDKRINWLKENKNKILITANKYQKQRKKIDVLFKLSSRTRTLISSSFSKNGYSKNSKTYLILGCTFKEFKLHLEKQFTKGMNWENQGKWHLDHIYPLSLAKDEEELIKLNHYTNFQPLWAKDNIEKGNKIIEKQLILI
jgi:hypothetical protein